MTYFLPVKYFSSILLILFTCSSFGQSSKPRKPEYYQFTVYHFSGSEQENILDHYLEQALLPALHRQGFKQVGVFKPLANDTAANKSLYVFTAFSSMNQFISVDAKLLTDTAYQRSGDVYINAVNTAPSYTRMERMIMQAFPLAPVMKMPALKAPKKERIYELRSYESATEKIFSNKVKMFNEGDEVGLFDRLGFNAAFYSTVLAGSKMPNLMYMTCFENMDDRNAHWKSFGQDAYWKKLSAIPEYQNNVSHIDITFLRPADYSDF